MKPLMIVRNNPHYCVDGLSP